MPALRNPRQEAFCLAYRENGGNSRRAYVDAGYTARLPRIPSETGSADACATKLLKRAQVQQRLQELAAMTAKRHEVTIDSLLSELEEARQLAHGEGQGSAAVQAVMGKARLTGLIIDRKESGAPGDFASLHTSEEVIEAIRKELGDEAARALQALLMSKKEGAAEDARAAPPTATHDPPDSVN